MCKGIFKEINIIKGVVKKMKVFNLYTQQLLKEIEPRSEAFYCDMCFCTK